MACACVELCALLPLAHVENVCHDEGMRKRTPRAKQLTFDRLLGRGRKRGRKKSPSSGVSHLKRAEVTGKVPVHVTTRVGDDIPNRRQPGVRETCLRCFREARERPGRSTSGWFRLVHFSIQRNHLHFVVEASDRKTLSVAICGLLGRLAKALNKLFGRKGDVFPERYHDHVLRTPRETYNASGTCSPTPASTGRSCTGGGRIRSARDCGSPAGGTTCTTVGWAGRGRWRRHEVGC